MEASKKYTIAPLEYEGEITDDPWSQIRADTFFGTYYIRQITEENTDLDIFEILAGFEWSLADYTAKGICDTIEECKAAIWADYTKRLTNALIEV